MQSLPGCYFLSRLEERLIRQPPEPEAILMKPIAPLLCLFLLLAGYSRADSIPSAELQTRLVNELHLEFIPRNPLREAAGYWHFWANVGRAGLSVCVPEGSTFDQIKTLAIATYQLENPATPTSTP
jgi:hypothetical protein